MSPVRLLAVGALVISAATLLVIGTRRFVERQRTTAEITRMREQLYRARVASDRCRSSLVTSEASLLTLTETIDSMRNRVDSFEALEAGGVPAQQYDAYLEVFDGYNDSVAAWEARSERLRAAEASCRSMIETHNALSDSIQGVLREAGIGEGGP